MAPSSITPTAFIWRPSSSSGPRSLKMLDTRADQIVPHLTDQPAWPTLRAHPLTLAAGTGEHPRGVAPHGVAGLDWMAGMGAENVVEFDAALAGEAALTAFLREAAAGLATIKAADVAPALGDLVPAVDVAVLNEAYGDYLAESFRESVSGGIDGWRDDDLAFVHDWGVPLNTGVPVSIWQGDKDRMVPHSHGEWLAAHIPGSRLHRRPDEGHLSLFVHEFDAIVADLAG